MPINPDGSWQLNAFNPADIRDVLENIEWGYTQLVGGITFLTCPWCLAVIPGRFTNDYELPSHTTPKAMHIQYHINMTELNKAEIRNAR